MSETPRMKKARQIAQELYKEGATEALTIITLATGILMRHLPPEKWEETVELQHQLLKMTPAKLPRLDAGDVTETTH